MQRQPARVEPALSHQAQRPSLQVTVLKVSHRAVSLLRLELSAALLLARLINKVRESLKLSQCPTYLWSDSTIALNWITSPSRRWSVFVANRVGEIQRLTEVERWHHPPTTLSRRINPYDLIEAERWWNGPEFLKWDEEHWPPSVFPRFDNDLPEQRKIRVAESTFHSYIIDDLLNKHSNLKKYVAS